MHMGSDAEARPLLARYGLADTIAVSDPERRFYRAFALGHATAGQMLGPRVWVRGVQALLAGHGMGRPVGDPRQMPGVVVLSRGVVTRRFDYRSVADRPDWEALLG